MSSHPCRAHHKLKWARKGQSGLEVLYELIPRSESSNAICAENSVARQNSVAYPNSARSTLFDRGWQQPLDHHKAQPARRVKDAEGTAKPLVLDSVRWLGYLAAVPSISSIRKNPLPSFNVLLCLYKYRSFSRPFDLCYSDNPPIIPQIGPVLFRYYLSILRDTKSPTP